LFAHSLTKYASGHGDVMGGAIIGRTELIDRMRQDLAILGPTLDPHAAYLVLRGMKTYYLRWDAQCRNAQAIAEFLAADENVERVRYPGLPGDPGHALASAQMSDFGTIVTFDIRGGLVAGTRFAEAPSFATTSSLGSRITGSPPAMQTRGFTESRCAGRTSARTVRLSAGIEAIEDLLATATGLAASA
jgi:cystathionine beta-lyase/cystathionine gamma-synthase